MAQVNTMWCWWLILPAFLIPEPKYMQLFFEACEVGQCGGFPQIAGC